MRQYDTIVIGAGAAGTMAAGIAAAQGARVLLCEKMEKPQRKVRITGKGRCNLTNLCSPEEFLRKVRAGQTFLAPVLSQFDCQNTRTFFEEIGVPLTLERGRRVFPTSGKAWDIAEAHLAWCRRQGVEILCYTRVCEILTRNGAVCGVRLQTRNSVPETVTCRQVILATGGLSYPATGSTGDGYTLAHQLGHSIVPLRPSLTPLRASLPAALDKLHLRNIAATLLIDGKTQAEEFGELEFSRKGVTGPIVLRLSRQAVDALIDEHQVTLQLDLKPALSTEQLSARFSREREALAPQTSLHRLASKLLPAALIGEWLRRAKLSADQPQASLTAADIQRLIRNLKEWTIPITDYAPFEEAIVTAGGVETDQIDPLTLESRLVQGLYFAGEILDLDADTGGYNLQIAYSTGYVAGMNGCKSLSSQPL